MTEGTLQWERHWTRARTTHTAGETGHALGGGGIEARQQRVRQGARRCRPGLGCAWLGREDKARLVAVVQGAGNGWALSSKGGGKAFGIMTKNEASPIYLNKALKGSRRATRQFRYNSEI